MVPVLSRWAAALLAAMAVAGMAACGGDEFEPLAPSDPGPIHVHGLGIDPADGTLYIATHTGLYRLPQGESRAGRVADRLQDTMGFTVVGANRFLGSGHPDLDEADEKGLPPLLGLIESRDGGETWEPISLLGEADFHVLRVAGDLVYGFDATGARLMVSSDGGRTWTTHAPPEPLVDLVVHPEDPDRVIAAGERRMYESVDRGATWQVLAEDTGLLGWPTSGRLFLVVPGGLVFASAGDAEWTQVGDVGGEPAAFLAHTSTDLYVALHDGTIRFSADGGATWRTRSTPEPRSG